MLSHLMIISILLSISFGAQALPKTEITTINGFEVHFVDLGRGSSLGVVFNVPVGTMHQEGRQLGAKHFLEHLLFTGNKRFPGYHTYSNTLKRAGGFYNAHTTDTNTFYYATGSAEMAELLINLQLSMLEGLEFNPEVFANEREVVVNEIAQENNKKDTHALRYMGLAKILPTEHPWARPRLGDADSLRSLTVDEMRALYEINYRPEFVKVAVIGNFSDPAFLQQIKGWTEKYLQPLKPSKEWNEKPLADAPMPSLLTDDLMQSSHRLQLKSDQVKQGLVIMEANAPNNESIHAGPLLTYYLNLQSPGTLLHKLKTELGWITSGGFYLQSYGTKWHLSFGYSPTAEGLKHRQDILRIMYQALKATSEHGPDENLLSMLKESLITGFEKSARSLDDFIQAYEDVLNQNGSAEVQIAAINAVTPGHIQSAVALFSPRKALYMDIGPSTQSKATIDPVFNREFEVVNQSEDVASYEVAFEQEVGERFHPQLKKVHLPEPMPAPSSGFFLRSKAIPHLAERWTLDVRKDLPDLSMNLRFILAPSSAKDLIALDLVLSSFYDRYRSELSFLHFKYKSNVGLGRSGHSLILSASGDDGYSAKALHWLLSELTHFKPQNEELKRAKEVFVIGGQSSYMSAWSADLVRREASQSIDPWLTTPLVTSEIAAQMTPEEINSAWQRLRQKAAFEVVGVGAVARGEYEILQQLARSFARDFLTSSDYQRAAARLNWNEQKIEKIKPFPIVRTPEAYASMRVYRGPKLLDYKDAAAFSTLASLLNTMVERHNRADQRLGYVHYATTNTFDGEHLFMSFVGQTEGPENARKIILGWEHVLNLIFNNQVSDSEYLDAIQSRLHAFLQQRTSAMDWVALYSGNLQLRLDPRAHELLISSLRELTPQDLKHMANKYLKAPHSSHMQLTLGNCEGLLSPL